MMILAWILDVSQCSELCLWRARFEVLRRLGRYRALASILLDMCLGWRCFVFAMILYMRVVAWTSYLYMVVFEFGETMRDVDFMILS